jgi:Protein of unknown function (DUF3551)
MRLTALALAAFVLAGASSAARAQNYPWCAHYDTGDNAYNCGFVTFGQCQMTISGMGGFCERNTQFQPQLPFDR